jgi:hypothetical protein
VVGVVVGQEDGADGLGLVQDRQDVPGVVGARIDHHRGASPDHPRVGALQGERPRIRSEDAEDPGHTITVAARLLTTR